VESYACTKQEGGFVMDKQTFKYGTGGKKPNRYPPEIKEKAVEMYERSRADFPTKGECESHVCELLGIGCTDSLRRWVRQAEIDAGARQGMTTDEREEMRKLRRENLELKRANGILKAASAFFAAELDRPQNR